MKKLFSIVLIAVLSLGVSRAQTVLFSEDFGSGIPAAWSNSGTAQGGANPYAVWRYTHNGSHGAYGSPTDFINSPTKANGFIIFDSDSLDNGGVAGAFGAGPAPAPQTVALTTTAIPIPSAYCNLQFYQYYRNFTSTTVIGVSTDNVNWSLDTINTGVGVNVATASNSLVSVDISPYILAGTQTGNVYISFIMDADYYFWMIDDISLTTLPDNDMGVVSSQGFSGSIGLFYTSIPASQADSFLAQSVYDNAGQLPQPNAEVTFNYSKNGSLISSQTSTPLPLLDYGVDTPAVSSELYTQGVGKYTVAISASSDSTDQNLLNNNDTLTFAVSDSVYSINIGNVVTTGYYIFRNSANLNSPIGNLFEVDQADTLTSITTAMVGGGAGNTVAGSIIQGFIYPVSYDNQTNVISYSPSILNTFSKTLATQDLSTTTIKNITMMIDNSSGNAVLAPGLYWAAVGPSNANVDTVIVVAATSYQTNGFPAGEATTTGELGYVSPTDAPYVNMNFGHPSSILVVDWTRSPNTTPIRPFQSVTFTPHTNGVGTGSTYRWDVTDQSGSYTSKITSGIFKDTFQDYTGSGFDTFTVCVTLINGSDSASYCNIVPLKAFGTGIQNVSALSNVNMVPNPTSGLVKIYADDVEGQVVITVMDILGNVVNSFNDISNGTFNKSYDLSNLSNGIYIVRIENAGTIVSKKLSISKQ